MVLSSRFVLFGLTALLLACVTASTTLAQKTADHPPVPLDARGFTTSMFQQENEMRILNKKKNPAAVRRAPTDAKTPEASSQPSMWGRFQTYFFGNGKK